MDIAHYHGKPEEFIEDLEKFGPSIIFIGWCFSSNGDVSISYLVSLLLTFSNCCPNPGCPSSEEKRRFLQDAADPRPAGHLGSPDGPAGPETGQPGGGDGEGRDAALHPVRAERQRQDTVCRRTRQDPGR